MNNDDRFWLIGILGALLIVAVVAVSVAMTAILADALTRDELPRCRDEQVLVGFGDFRDGRWDEYTCAWLSVEP